MIPANQLNPKAASMLMEYLRTEIFRTLSERRPLEEKWIKYQRMYRATPPVAQREFPFVGASNLVVPLIATDVDVIYSRLMGVLFQPENLWSCRALRPDMVDFAPRLQEFLQWAQYRELDAYNAVADFILELTKLGTGVLKQRYKREQRRVYQYRETPQGPLEEFVSLLISDHPVLQHVSLYDFLVPSVATNVQEAPWVAERVMMNYGQYTNRVRAGVYAWNDRIGQNSFVDTGSQVVQQMQALDRFQPGLAQQLELWEAWLDFDLGMGEPMAVVATLHLPSNSLVRLDYNPFFHQEKPYSSARFMRQEKRFYGIGIAEMLEMSQEEITAMHNQRIDTGTIANSLMMKARKGSGIKQDEPIFPGRWFLLDNLQDIEPINWGSAHVNSTIQDEMTTRGYATNRTGVNDVIMGSPSATSGYGTATGNTLIHQEAAKRFDQTLREVRVALGESGVRLVELYQQFDQGGKLYHAMGEKEGAVVQQILQFPMELIRYGVGVDVTATSASLNKESEIRTNTIIMQLMQGFYQQMIQGMMMVLNPQMPVELRAMVVQSLNAGNIMARRLLDSYGIQDVDQLIPQLQEILNGGQSQLNSFTPPYGAGALPPGGAGPSAGMAALPPGPQGVQGFGSQQVTYA